MNPAFEGLEPAAMWRYFDMISKIPRGSGNEAAVQAAIAAEGKKHDLEVRRDAVGNVVLVVPASPGCESWPTVVLQGHVDMVCEKNRDVDHDFDEDAIKVIRDGDWLTADGTTLGADNGVAVSAALALLDDPPEKHPLLELLFTTDEERGLTGAGGIEPHMLSGKRLLNLDSEEEGFVTVGCAGGGDTLVTMEVHRDELPDGWQLRTVEVRGLAGGHSGIDIIENRANSLRCIGRVLDRVARVASDVRLLTLAGGSKRNAIPREAFATVALSPDDVGHLERARSQVVAELTAEFGATDPQIAVSIAEAGAGKPWSAADTRKAIALLLATPSGVLAMDRGIAGLVETSNNLGVVEMEGDTLRFVNCTRSSIVSARDAVQEGIRAMAEALGADVRLANAYPGWKPNLDAELLGIFKRVHKEVTGKEVEVVAIHAGLECGILGERFPGMEMISFGPDLEGVHAPGEKLSIPSSRRFYALLKALLGALS